MTSQTLWHPTSELLTSKSLVLLSGEGTSVPTAEAKALFLAYDPDSRFEAPERRVLIVESKADPSLVSSRIAFARRVGLLLADTAEAAALLRGRRFRLRSFDLVAKNELDPESYLRGIEGDVDLTDPECELTLVRGAREYLALTTPGRMDQYWSRRRPRARPFFHPSAIFPKLSRALVNLSRCRAGEVFLDPFVGTGSILLEAALARAHVLGLDKDARMVQGALSNMRHFGQRWLGVIRADAFRPPLTAVDAVATDIPYGRASSTGGIRGSDVLQQTLSTVPSVLKRGSRLVVMHSRETTVEGNEELVLEEEHHLYIHRLLTRTITVLRRR